jgi:tryptophan synthase alpha chain
VTWLETHLRQRRGLARPLLVPYVMAGITGDWTDLLCAMAGAGADAVEVGLPFSDPMVDGLTLQQASARALGNGARPSRLVEELKDVEAGIPVVLMAYANTVHAPGVGSFVDRAAGARIAGLIVPDLPLEESQEYEQVAAAAGIAAVLLAAPSCPDDRIGAICTRSRGFVDAVSAMRPTGERDILAGSALPIARRVKSCTDRPVLAGFGISSPDQAAAVAAVADGVVVASSLMRLLVDGATAAAVLDAVAALREALDGVA